MKFSAQLKEAIVPEWKAHYLDYELLKEALLKAEEDGAFTDRNETEFVELLDSNLEKVWKKKISCFLLLKIDQRAGQCIS